MVTGGAVSGQPVRVAIYCRVSTSGQAEDGSSLKTQEAACRAYAEEREWQVVLVERETHTGTDLLGRKRLAVVRDAVRKREVDVLLAHALDRLGRDQNHLGVLFTEAEGAGVTIDLATEDLDDTPMGQMLRAIMGAFAAIEREKIVERTMRGTRARVESGKRLVGPKPPYGYAWTDDVDDHGKALRSGLVEDPATSWVVRRIFTEYAAGIGVRRIARMLSEDGVPTPMPHRAKDTSGTPAWNPYCLYVILKNPVYVGESLAYRRQAVAPKRGGKRKSSTAMRPADQQVRLEAPVPALVDRATWDHVQAKYAVGRLRSERSNAPKEDTLLRTFVRCGHCGNAMHRNHASVTGLVFYRCDHYDVRPGCGKGHRILANWLDGMVWTGVEAFLSEPGVVLRDRERAAAAGDTTAASLAGLDALAARRQALLVERAKVAGEADARKAAQAQIATLAEWCRQALAEAGTLDYAGKRAVLDRLGAVVRVYRKGTNVMGRFDLELAPIGYTLDDAKGKGVQGYWAAKGVRSPTEWYSGESGRTASDPISAMPFSCSMDGNCEPEASRSTAKPAAGRPMAMPPIPATTM